MSSSRRLSDLIGLLRGLRKVGNSFGETHYKNLNLYWSNSSLNQVSASVNLGLNQVSSKVGEKIEVTVSNAVVKQAQLQSKVDKLDQLIPKELKLPPVTEADLEELSKDIDSLGFTLSSRPASSENDDTTSETEGTTTVVAPRHAPAGGAVKVPLSRSADIPVEPNNMIYATGAAAVDSGLTSSVGPDELTNSTGLDHKLSSKSRETRVPANRLSRVMSFGSLAAGLGVGAAAEVARRTLGLSDAKAGPEGSGSLLSSSPFLSDANMERIVSTLCRVRGAALKLGQMMSIQDNTMLNPQLQAAFERVRQSADFMPLSQLERAMADQLGADWRNSFSSFDDKPFAAASIGQVHRASLPDGRLVAVKIQYPGVARSINSDIKNLLSILKVWQILPKGMYAENLIDVSRFELAWECDYKREAHYMKLFRELLADDPVFLVPRVFEELSTDQVLVTELIPGVALDKCSDLSQETRDELGRNLLRLCLTELYDWNVMQTDPNWSNFFYDSKDGKVYLLDFGATREYSRRFVDSYIDIIKAAAVNDRDTILDKSRQLGFLTGYETKAMVEAHIEAVAVLGGPCGKEGKFDFGQQDITKKIENIIPVMLKHRLGPPPEETYSLHRKLSGAFLLCAKLKSRVDLKSLYDPIFHNYEYGLADRVYKRDDSTQDS